MPILPPAPPRFSTITSLPSASPSGHIDQPSRDVGAAAGGKARDHGDLPLGIFRACWLGDRAGSANQNHHRQCASQNMRGERDVRHGAFLPGVFYCPMIMAVIAVAVTCDGAGGVG